MTENNQSEDEYQFSELDPLSVDNESEEPSSKNYEQPLPKQGPDIKRIILTLLVVIVFAMVAYKLVALILADKGRVVVAPPNKPVQVQTKAVQPVVQKPVVVETKPMVVAEITQKNDDVMQQKLSAVALAQDNMRSEMMNATDKIAAMGAVLNELNAKIIDLNQHMDDLRKAIDNQEQKIEPLIHRPMVVKKHKAHRVHAPMMVYYLQALIPGRAWLIADNGTTVTVRKGSRLQGYGVIKAIDPVEGLVRTSSGKIIRFSQADS